MVGRNPTGAKRFLRAKRFLTHETDSNPIPRSDADRSPFEPDRRPTGVEPIRGAGPTRPVATSAAGRVGSGDRTVEAVRRRNDLDCPERVEI